MGGLLLLLALSAVMALASFLAGALPLSMTLTQSQLRFVSSIGVGILVGTSLIVIIPEGVEAIVDTSLVSTAGSAAGAAAGSAAGAALRARHLRGVRTLAPKVVVRSPAASVPPDSPHALSPRTLDGLLERLKRDEEPAVPEGTPHCVGDLPTFQIGFALVSGFVCMFLIDRLPRHAVDRLQTTPTTRHISLDNLGMSGAAGDGEDSGDAEEAAGFLGSLTPSPRQSRGLATTAGLVIHATADGIAMGASATTEDMKLGLVIFVAIMLHKAPAAFGLTSVLLKHGLSKRAARGHLVLFSLAAPFGALSTYIFIELIWGSNIEGERGQYWTGLLLLFSAGTFLYVAMQAMQEDGSSGGGAVGGGGHDHHLSVLGNGYVDSSTLAAQRKQNRPQMRDTLATIAGMLLPLLTQFGHHH